jgi:phosphate transport system permease protein
MRADAAFADAGFRRLTQLAAFLVFGLLAAIVVSLAAGGARSIGEFGWAFLWTAEWDPVRERFGALVPIVGTLATSAIALAIAVPVSLGIAVFLTELSPAWLKRPLGTAIEMLAAIPSIIYGMWGLFHLVPLLGLGLMTAGVILAVMVTPFIASVMRDVFELVPPVLKESAYGLGSTTWEVVWKVVLPYTRAGVIGGIMLGLGRALGETMAVTFVIGNAHRLAPSLFAPGNSIASALANEFTEAVGELHTAALVELGLILFLLTTAVLAAAKLLLLRLAAREGASA